MLRQTNHRIPLFSMLQRHRSTSPIYLNKIFRNSVDPPPTWPKFPLPLSIQTSSSRQWEEAKLEEKRLPFGLRVLQDRLRSLHKRKIAWPSEESVDPSIAPNEYLAMLLHPIAEILNQMRTPDVLKTPMEYISINIGEYIYGATFIADDFKKDKISAPIVICLPDAIFQSPGMVSSRVEFALSRALDYQPLVPSIIVTNFNDMAVFFPPSRDQPKPLFERVSTTQPGLAVRVIATACLLRELHFTFRYINAPEPVIESNLELIGPPNDPRQPLLPDKELLETYRRHSDFDFITLIHDRPRALQFFRWHDLVRQHYSKVVAHSDDILACITNEVGMELLDIQPCYPYDASELPADTVTHLETIHRESPLVIAGVHDAFKRSKTFTLKIENVIAEGSERGICTVYRCQITSIDGHLISSPSICLKLFDDRFQMVELPEEDDPLFQDEYIPEWFKQVVIAELHALNEKFAYDKLLPAQGTIIPWFYGMHQFTLPDGTVLYGLLMEYIEGGNLESNFAHHLSPDRQIDFIRSCRHAVRVLDVADISQRDWHSGQIILHTDSRTHIDHVVFIDLASTTQTWDPDTPNSLENYFHVFRILLGDLGDLSQHVPFNSELVWEHYGEPDDWDPIHISLRRHPGDKAVAVQAEDMFPYITLM